MNQLKHKQLKHQLRKGRVRSIVSGTINRPRLSVFRSNNQIYAQVIDDETGKTLAASSSLNVKVAGKKLEQAAAIGKDIAAKAHAKGIKTVVFDRGGYKYHGRVKAVADSAREAGLKF
ncbi:MAG TPA: 50S ribosomal protein L18 [Candidatus Doudnabacteria bacterium]|nr:50S ribosomal protein L18 [Candidatus Doudnabacteria bacterium]